MSRQQADYAAAAEGLESGIAREPGSVAAWMEWVDFALERFRILDLEPRGGQSGMAAVLRFEAEGLRSRTQTREELLPQSAAGDPEQPGIGGESSQSLASSPRTSAGKWKSRRENDPGRAR